MGKIMEKIIELSDNEKNILGYVCDWSGYKEIAQEVTFKKIGHTILDEYDYINGFKLNLEGDISIEFLRQSSTDYMADLTIFYKSETMFKYEIQADNHHWNGTVHNLKVKDFNDRAEKTFRFIIKLFEKEFYIPFLENKKNNKLQIDSLYEEFDEKIDSENGKINKKTKEIQISNCVLVGLEAGLYLTTEKDVVIIGDYIRDLNKNQPNVLFLGDKVAIGTTIMGEPINVLDVMKKLQDKKLRETYPANVDGSSDFYKAVE